MSAEPSDEGTAGRRSTRLRKLRAPTIVGVSAWGAAVLAGLAAVLFAKAAEVCQRAFFRVDESHPWLVSAAIPLLFLAASAIVRFSGPDAKGSGIPQVLLAIESGPAAWTSPLVSLRTAVVKVCSMLVGLLGGASIGREGPTVQIAASLFAAVGRGARRLTGSVDPRAFLVSGAAAGVAAAFNAPLAGITFALEELAEEGFVRLRETTSLAIVVAGIAARALLGDYVYFGRSRVPPVGLPLVLPAFVAAAVAGTLGGLFARLLSRAGNLPLPRVWWRRALLCGVLASALTLATSGLTAGSGYEVTRRGLELGDAASIPILFAPAKLLATVVAYASGMAGGIFAPSLSIGAGAGLAVARLFPGASAAALALIGMVAFFSGAIQAPLTGVVIVTEMTDQHPLVLFFLGAAFLGRWLGRLFLERPLYQALALRHAEG